MTEGRVLLVTGGRAYADEERVFRKLDAMQPRPRLLLVGDASGADTIARRWAEDRGVPVRVFKADWSVGRKAGPIRNQAMLDAGPDVVVAFPGGRGTADMVSRARAKGVPVHVVSAQHAQFSWKKPYRLAASLGIVGPSTVFAHAYLVAEQGGTLFVPDRSLDRTHTLDELADKHLWHPRPELQEPVQCWIIPRAVLAEKAILMLLDAARRVARPLQPILAQSSDDVAVHVAVRESCAVEARRITAETLFANSRVLSDLREACEAARYAWLFETGAGGPWGRRSKDPTIMLNYAELLEKSGQRERAEVIRRLA